MTQAPHDFVDSRDFARIARAIRYIEQHYQEQPRLAVMAAQADLSEFHFNRLFRRWAGLTPKQYLAFVTGNAAKRALSGDSSVLDVAYSVGLSGPGRLHDLIVSLDGVTPGEWKSGGEGLLVRYGTSPTPFGTALLATTPRGVCHLAFLDERKLAAPLQELQHHWPDARTERDDAHARDIAEQIWTDTSAESEVKVHVRGTNFQLKVWQAILELGAHGPTTYTDVATAIGSPSATRAVGHAVGSNQVAWLIPCHNVLRKDGELGGYRWGEDRKRAMLAWASLPTPASRSATPTLAARR